MKKRKNIKVTHQYLLFVDTTSILFQILARNVNSQVTQNTPLYSLSYLKTKPGSESGRWV